MHPYYYVQYVPISLKQDPLVSGHYLLVLQSLGVVLVQSLWLAEPFLSTSGFVAFCVGGGGGGVLAMITFGRSFELNCNEFEHAHKR